MGWEDPLEWEMATCSSIIAWKTPWTEEPDRLQSMRLQRVRCDWVTEYKGLHRFFWLIFTSTTKNAVNQNSPPPSHMNLDSASSSSYFPKGVYTCQRHGGLYYLPAPKNEWLYWKWSWRDQVCLIMGLERLGKQLSNNHLARRQI